VSYCSALSLALILSLLRSLLRFLPALPAAFPSFRALSSSGSTFIVCPGVSLVVCSRSFLVVSRSGSGHPLLRYPYSYTRYPIRSPSHLSRDPVSRFPLPVPYLRSPVSVIVPCLVPVRSTKSGPPQSSGSHTVRGPQVPGPVPPQGPGPHKGSGFRLKNPYEPMSQKVTFTPWVPCYRWRRNLGTPF